MGKMALLTNTIKEGNVQLGSFMLIFFISMFAFSNLFYVLLGVNIGSYYSQVGSFLTMFRALFGDFDIDEIDENSDDNLNSILFMAYLFIAIFILLSMFLAILSEAQTQVLDHPAKTIGPKGMGHEYGYFGV